MSIFIKYFFIVVILSIGLSLIYFTYLEYRLSRTIISFLLGIVLVVFLVFGLLGVFNDKISYIGIGLFLIYLTVFLYFLIMASTGGGLLKKGFFDNDIWVFLSTLPLSIIKEKIEFFRNISSTFIRTFLYSLFALINSIYFYMVGSGISKFIRYIRGIFIK